MFVLDKDAVTHFWCDYLGYKTVSTRIAPDSIELYADFGLPLERMPQLRKDKSSINTQK